MDDTCKVEQLYLINKNTNIIFFLLFNDLKEKIYLISFIRLRLNSLDHAGNLYLLGVNKPEFFSGGCE